MTGAPRLAGAVALAMCGCATDTIVANAPISRTDVAIAPYELQEECAQLLRGDRLDYRFEAKAPVTFSLYYQEGVTFVSPVSRDDITVFADVFLAPSPRRYCLRWEAGRDGALIDYRVRLLRGDKP